MDLIIGAGISGISYANFTDNDYLIIEQSSSPGGYCKTTYQDGFVWDYSGHFFHFRQPEIEAYVCKNIAPEILRHVEKHTQILYKGQYINFPFQKTYISLPKRSLLIVFMIFSLLPISSRILSKKWFVPIWVCRLPKNF